MSTQSLLRFLEELNKDLSAPDIAKEKRLEYNLYTHTFGYEEEFFILEMLKELRTRGIRISKKRSDNLVRLANIFTKDLYRELSALNEKAKAKSGITRLSGNEKSFSFVFTTDIRTGKCPNNWAQGQADVFDKIKQVYGESYRRFFFGVRDIFEKGTKGREKFDLAFKRGQRLSKGQMGQSGHAEGEGIVETMTREFFDKHANLVFNKKSPKEQLTEAQLLSDLQKLGIDLSFMRNTKDKTFSISLIGRGGNDFDGKAIRAQVASAKKRMDELINNPEMIKFMAEDLKGSDSFSTIQQKELAKKATDPFKKVKKARVKTQNTKVKHSKKTVTKKNKSSGSAAGRKKQAIKVAGVADLKRRKQKESIASQPLQLLTMLNQKLPETVRKNMKSPGLVNRSGRFADSVEVVDVTQTPKGFPSFGYTYRKNPYQVFEEGAGKEPWADGNRDPRELIDRSIREVAKDMAIGRFFTRRI